MVSRMLRDAGTVWLVAWLLCTGCGQSGPAEADESGVEGTDASTDLGAREDSLQDSLDVADADVDEADEIGDVDGGPDGCETVPFESAHRCFGWGAVPEDSYPACLAASGDVWVVDSRACLDEVVARAGQCCFGGGSCCEAEPSWLAEVDFATEQVIAIGYTGHDYDPRCPTAGLLCFPRLRVMSVADCGGCLCVAYAVEEDPCVGPDVSCPDAAQLPIALVRTPRGIPVCLAPCVGACS
jgi:hypothetical protein